MCFRVYGIWFQIVLNDLAHMIGQLASFKLKGLKGEIPLLSPERPECVH